jgi:hypothetical protein
LAQVAVGAAGLSSIRLGRAQRRHITPSGRYGWPASAWVAPGDAGSPACDSWGLASYARSVHRPADHGQSGPSRSAVGVGGEGGGVGLPVGQRPHQVPTDRWQVAAPQRGPRADNWSRPPRPAPPRCAGAARAAIPGSNCPAAAWARPARCCRPGCPTPGLHPGLILSSPLVVLAVGEQVAGQVPPAAGGGGSRADSPQQRGSLGRRQADRSCSAPRWGAAAAASLAATRPGTISRLVLYGGWVRGCDLATAEIRAHVLGAEAADRPRSRGLTGVTAAGADRADLTT